MKNPFLTYTVILVLSISTILVSSCKKEVELNETENDMVGTWTLGQTSVEITVDGINVIEYLTTFFDLTEAEAQAAVDSIVSEINEDNKGSIAFKADKSYHISFTNSGDQEDGNWSVSNDGNTLNLYFEDEENNLAILSLTTSAALLGLPTEYEDVDVDDDGVNETTLKMDMELSLTK